MASCTVQVEHKLWRRTRTNQKP